MSMMDRTCFLEGNMVLEELWRISVFGGSSTNSPTLLRVTFVATLLSNASGISPWKAIPSDTPSRVFVSVPLEKYPFEAASLVILTGS